MELTWITKLLRKTKHLKNARKKGFTWTNNW
jgi:hypothetical protein